MADRFFARPALSSAVEQRAIALVRESAGGGNDRVDQVVDLGGTMTLNLHLAAQCTHHEFGAIIRGVAGLLEDRPDPKQWRDLTAAL